MSPIELLADSVNELERAIQFSPGVVTSSHVVVTVTGLESPVAATALGRYLVGAVAGAVDLDARLSHELLAQGVDRQKEIAVEVRSLIRDTNVFITEEECLFRDTRRNAWIGEGLPHALLMLSARQVTSCVDGQICTFTSIHPTTTRQGLDSVSTYVQGGVLGVAIGESKSTRSRPSENLGDAIGLFVKIEDGEYQQDLRTALLAFRWVLPSALKEQLRDSLWTENASYLPTIVHQEPYEFTTHRPNLAKLAQPVARRRVITVRLDDFGAFFDAVADAMRAAVFEVVV